MPTSPPGGQLRLGVMWVLVRVSSEERGKSPESAIRSPQVSNLLAPLLDNFLLLPILYVSTSGLWETSEGTFGRAMKTLEQSSVKNGHPPGLPPEGADHQVRPDTTLQLNVTQLRIKYHLIRRLRGGSYDHMLSRPLVSWCLGKEILKRKSLPTSWTQMQWFEGGPVLPQRSSQAPYDGLAEAEN